MDGSGLDWFRGAYLVRKNVASKKAFKEGCLLSIFFLCVINWVFIWLKIRKIIGKGTCSRGKLEYPKPANQNGEPLRLFPENSAAFPVDPIEGHHTHQPSLWWPAVTFDCVSYLDYRFASEQFSVTLQSVCTFYFSVLQMGCQEPGNAWFMHQSQ